MIRLALTGSIGMGKSTMARLFAERGVPVWDADEAVHRLYAAGGAGAAAIAALVPHAVGEAGVERAALRTAVIESPELLAEIEAAIHPLVAEDRAGFLARAEAAGAAAALCDIPLLYETGAEGAFDATIVVSAPPEVQRARVLRRPGMTPESLAAILARQLPDAQKRARADHVIDTSGSIEASARQIDGVLAQLGLESPADHG